MGKKNDQNQDVAVTFGYRDTDTGREGRGVATGATVEDVAAELDALSKGSDVEVIDPRVQP